YLIEQREGAQARHDVLAVLVHDAVSRLHQDDPQGGLDEEVRRGGRTASLVRGTNFLRTTPTISAAFRGKSSRNRRIGRHKDSASNAVGWFSDVVCNGTTNW